MLYGLFEDKRAVAIDILGKEYLSNIVEHFMKIALGTDITWLKDVRKEDQPNMRAIHLWFKQTVRYWAKDLIRQFLIPMIRYLDSKQIQVGNKESIYKRALIDMKPKYLNAFYRGIDRISGDKNSQWRDSMLSIDLQKSVLESVWYKDTMKFLESISPFNGNRFLTEEQIRKNYLKCLKDITGIDFSDEIR